MAFAGRYQYDWRMHEGPAEIGAIVRLQEHCLDKDYVNPRGFFVVVKATGTYSFLPICNDEEVYPNGGYIQNVKFTAGEFINLGGYPIVLKGIKANTTAPNILLVDTGVNRVHP